MEEIEEIMDESELPLKLPKDLDPNLLADYFIELVERTLGKAWHWGTQIFVDIGVDDSLSQHTGYLGLFKDGCGNIWSYQKNQAQPIFLRNISKVDSLATIDQCRKWAEDLHSCLSKKEDINTTAYSSTLRGGGCFYFWKKQ